MLYATSRCLFILTDGAELDITSQTDFNLSVFWGADIAETFHLMNKEWPDIVDLFNNETILKGHCLFKEETKMYPCSHECIINAFRSKNLLITIIIIPK